MRLLVLAVAAAFMGAPVIAHVQPSDGVQPEGRPPSPRPSPPPPEVKKKDPIICKRQEEIGSRLGGKQICMTKSQWDDQRADAQRSFTNAQAVPR